MSYEPRSDVDGEPRLTGKDIEGLIRCVDSSPLETDEWAGAVVAKLRALGEVRLHGDMDKEFDALCEVIDVLVECVVTRAEMAQWELEHAVRVKLGEEAAERVEQIVRGCRWAEFDSAPEPKPAGTGPEPKVEGAARSSRGSGRSDRFARGKPKGEAQ